VAVVFNFGRRMGSSDAGTLNWHKPKKVTAAIRDGRDDCETRRHGSSDRARRGGESGESR